MRISKSDNLLGLFFLRTSSEISSIATSPEKRSYSKSAPLQVFPSFFLSPREIWTEELRGERERERERQTENERGTFSEEEKFFLSFSLAKKSRAVRGMKGRPGSHFALRAQLLNQWKFSSSGKKSKCQKKEWMEKRTKSPPKEKVRLFEIHCTVYRRTVYHNMMSP